MMICCRICHEEAQKIERASFVVPRYVSDDPRGHVEWVAVCAEHERHWYEHTHLEGVLPTFRLWEWAHRNHPDHSSLRKPSSSRKSNQIPKGLTCDTCGDWIYVETDGTAHHVIENDDGQDHDAECSELD